MPGTAKTKIRRQRVRKQRAETSASLWERFRGSVGLWPAFVFVVFATGAAVIALSGRQSLGYSVGQKIDQPIIARVAFEWINEAQTERARQDARAASPTFYRTNQALIDDLATSVRTLYQDAKASETYEAFAEAANAKGWTATEELFGQLRQLMDEQGGEVYAQWVERLRERLPRIHAFRRSDSQLRQPPASGSTVSILYPAEDSAEGEEAKPVEVEALRLYPIANAEQMQRLAREVVEHAGFPPAGVQPAIRAMLEKRLTAEPILLYDAAPTEEAMQRAASAVQPAVISYKPGQPIVTPTQSGEDDTLTVEQLARLKAEDEQYRSMMESDAPAAAPLRKRLLLERAGTATIIVLISLAFFIYVGRYQPRILQVRTRTIALGSLVLAMLVAARLIELRLQSAQLILVPALVLAACVTIAYPRRSALGMTAIAGLLVVQTVRGDIGLFVTLLVGVSLTTYWLNDIRKRTQIITVGVLTGLAVSVITFAYGLIDKQAVIYAARLAALSGGSAVSAALIVQGILPFIERTFGIATSLTLLEWSVADKLLLQRLAREAPGTYNHSLVLGTMAEPACEAIDANGLLVRVGALYHDIGKMQKADYFAENQEASISRHDKLAASMSLLIILGHVKDGIELAKEYGLPRVLHPFIEEHHGTTVVRYFHHKASEQQPSKAVGRHDREISEAEFRYPGPKPRSKESAVLMLCDGVESAVRSLSEPTAGRIESVVHQVVMDRLNDGQFGDCDITLKELQTVEDSLVKSLCRFYHGRVAYPKAQPEKEEAAREEDEDHEQETGHRKPA